MFKKITSSIACCVVLCASGSLAMNDPYPSATITTINNSDHKVKVYFTAAKNIIGQSISAGSYKTKGNGPNDSTTKIVHTYELTNEKLSITAHINTLEKSLIHEMLLPTTPEYTIERTVAGSNVVYTRKLVRLGGLISTEPGVFTSNPERVIQCELTVTVPFNDTK